MRRRLKALLCAALAAMTLWLPGGCVSARELNELVVVMGMGMDRDEDNPDGIKLIAQIVLPGKISTSSEGGASSSEDPFINLASSADNTFEAVREYTHMVSGRLYIAHAQVFVIGREMAQQGIAPFLDFFVRASETRPNTRIVISDTTASDVLNVKPKISLLPAIHISKLIEAQIDNSQSREATLLDYINAMQSSTASFLAPIVKIEEIDGERLVVVSGMAVFKQDSMVGQLTEEETRGVLWVEGEVKSGIINVEIEGGIAALEVLSASSDVSPVISDGRVTMNIEISVTAALGEQTSEENLATVQNMERLTTLLQTAICDEIATAYEKAAALRADVFGFGELLGKYYSEQWRDMESHWDDLFPTTTLSISIDAAIKSAGAVEEPAWHRGENPS